MRGSSRDGWTRRHWLRVVSTSGVAVALGCAAEDEQDGPREVELASSALADGDRKLVHLGRLPVELRREQGALVATVLRCTHQGCAVRWDSAKDQYACGCHGGKFNAHGRPIAGPPRHPLRRLPVEVVGDRIVVRRS